MRTLIAVLLLSAQAALANSFDLGFVDLPKAEDVVAFTNGLPPAAGKRELKTKDQILYFLTHGKYTDKSLRREEVLVEADRLSACDGIFTDKAGRFYFWKMITPTILKIVTPEAGSAILRLDAPQPERR